MMIQEIKQGMKVRNAGGDVFEIMGTKGYLVIVKMLENHSDGWKVNYIHQTFIPGKVLEIDQPAELVTAEGYYEVALEYLEPVEEAEELEIPMFNQEDYVKDKFGNIFKIVAVVAPQHFEQGSDEYDNMGYRLELIDKDPNSPLREVGESSGAFYRQGDMLWIFNTKEDIKAEGYKVTPAHITATELVIFEEAETAVKLEEIEESDIPILFEGDLVKDAFGNTFEVVEAKPRQRLDPDRFDYCNMGYRLKLVTKNPTSPIREVHDNVKFLEEGNKYWVYNREEDARNVKEFNHTITASELVLSKSVFQVELRKTLESATPAKAEISKRYPSIEDLQKISEENDLGKLLDQAYEILKEQASFGNRNANLNFEKFKRCIPHFEREGFDITERGDLIEVRW